jgi:hypothetical protein
LVRLPAATVTEAATVRFQLLVLRATTAPPVGATLESVTVHAPLAPELRLAGLQASDLTVTGATNERDADADVEL